MFDVKCKISKTVIIFSETKFKPEFKEQLLFSILHAYTLYTWAECAMDRLCYVPSLFGWSFLVNIVFYSIPGYYYTCHLHELLLTCFSNEKKKKRCEGQKETFLYTWAEFVIGRDYYGSSSLWAEMSRKPLFAYRVVSESG